jgi:hypothetical protein
MSTQDEPTGPAPHTTDQPAQPPPSRGGRTVGIVLSSIVGLFGLVILIGGIALIAVHLFARDDDGFYSTNTEELRSNGYAVATDEIDLGGGSGGFSVDDLSATVRIDASSADGKPVFVGIGPTTDVDRYLDGVAHSEVTDFDGGPQYTQHAGGAPSGLPGAQGFWVARSQGLAGQRVEWDLDNGNYTAVAMNAGGSRGVGVDVDVGAKVSWLIWVGVGLTVVGLLIVGAVVFGISRLARERRIEPAPTSAGA